MRSRAQHVFELTGGALCLDFANTLGDRPRCSEEHLGDYRALLEWARQARVLEPAQVRRLAQDAARRPGAAREAHAQALCLREALYRVVAARRRGEPPRRDDLGLLNAWLKRALARLTLVPGGSGSGLAWAWADGPLDLTRPLWPVVRSAAELLSSGEATRLRECASQTCSWLFLDTSRTQRRRWCDMRTCGNRDKARRHYARLKQRAAVAHPRTSRRAAAAARAASAARSRHREPR